MITDKQKKVLDQIVEFITRYGKAPTIEELQNILGQKSKRWVVQYLDSLEKRGFITRWTWFRSIKLGNGVWFQTMLNIPILGIANAGMPLVYAQESDYGLLPISKNIIKKDKSNYFLVKVEWTSMNDFTINDKNINNGSLALIDKTYNTFEENDAYLFVINGCATLKTMKKEGNNIYLLPKSRDDYHQPIVLDFGDDIVVNWKVVDVFNFE